MMTLHQATDQVKPHVLVVDDEAELCQMVAVNIQQSGFRVSAVENVANAISLLEQDQYDAVVTDVMMPGEDGISFLGRVRQAWPDIPVILMSGHAQLQMAVNAIKNGAFDFVQKPFDFGYMRKIVERAVNYSKLQRMEKNYRAELEETVVLRTAELKKSMTELDFARKALLQAANDKSAFMSTISHEMRTPMNGIIGSLDLLSDENLTAPAATYLAMACQSAENMTAMIEQLLSFNAQNVLGGGTTHYELIDLQAFLQNIIADQQPLFAHKGISLDLQFADDLPRQIWSDQEKMCRLFEILTGNALKFTERGYVSIAVSRVCTEEEGESLLCTVTDSGIGIPDGMLERIFEPFVQGDGSFSRRYEGVGLGLAIARQNALLLNGRLWAEHVTDGGSRFTLALKITTQ